MGLLVIGRSRAAKLLPAISEVGESADRMGVPRQIWTQDGIS